MKKRYENVDLIIFQYISEKRKINEDTLEAIKQITRPASQQIILAAWDYTAARQRKSYIRAFSDHLKAKYRSVSADLPGVRRAVSAD